MRISLLTDASTEFWNIMQFTAPNKLEYCLKWGIQFSMRKNNGKNAPVWGEREIFMLETLRECDWLWFMGADTLIMNHQIDVRIFLDDRYDFIIGHDVNGINNDVFFLRNNHRSHLFLQKVLASNSYFPQDQIAMQYMAELIPGFKMSVVHQKQFNSFLYSEYNYPDDKGGSFSTGDFVLHLPGMSNHRRLQLIQEYLPQVIK